MILFIGQVARDQVEREAFQEVDFRRMFGAARQMGGADRRCRAHPRTGQPGLPPRRRRPARSGGDRAARGHADRPRRGRPTPAPYKTVQPHPGAGRAGRPCAICWPRPSGRSLILGGGGWTPRRCATSAPSPRPTICRSASPSAARICSTTAIPNYAGHVGIGINPALARAGEGRRSAAGRRRAAGRDDHQRLHAARGARAAADADPRPCRRRGAGPRLSADAADQCRHGAVRRGGARAAAGRSGAPGRPDRAGRTADYLATLEPRAMPARCRCGRDRHLAARAPAAPTPSSPTAPATTPPGCTASTSIAASAPSWRRPAAPWAMACRPRWRPRPCIPSARSCASPATAAS